MNKLNEPSPEEAYDRDEEMAAAFRFFLERTPWGVSELALASGMPETTLRGIEMGCPTDTETLNLVCYAFGVHPWLFWLIGLIECEKADPGRARRRWSFILDPEAYGRIAEGVELLLMARAGEASTERRMES